MSQINMYLREKFNELANFLSVKDMLNVEKHFTRLDKQSERNNGNVNEIGPIRRDI